MSAIPRLVFIPPINLEIYNDENADLPGDEAEHPAKILILVGVEQVLELSVEDLKVLLNQNLNKKTYFLAYSHLREVHNLVHPSAIWFFWIHTIFCNLIRLSHDINDIL